MCILIFFARNAHKVIKTFWKKKFLETALNFLTLFSEDDSITLKSLSMASGDIKDMGTLLENPIHATLWGKPKDSTGWPAPYLSISLTLGSVSL